MSEENIVPGARFENEHGNQFLITEVNVEERLATLWDGRQELRVSTVFLALGNYKFLRPPAENKADESLLQDK